MDSLKTITELSHEFGSDDFVKGGGGNTSCKTTETLWVKPSGTTLGGLQLMNDAAREFIENWEVESYRAKQMQ